MTFPFDAVYKHVAHVMLSEGLPKDHDLRPMGFVVYAMEGEHFKMMPMPDIAHYCINSNGRDALSAKIRELLKHLSTAKEMFGVESFGVVLIHEAYMAIHDFGHIPSAEEREAHRKTLPDSVKDMPGAKAALVINMITPDKTIFGYMEIDANRKLIYSPLNDALKPDKGSRFTHLDPEKDTK